MERTNKNFLEVETVEEANTIDMKIWKFITYDGKYVFARRAKPLVEQMVKLNKVIHNGAVFWNHYGKRNYDGLMTLENERAVITGWFSLALMTNSYKFRDQLQIHIFAPKGCGQKEYRNESIWNGTEINIDVDEIDDIIEALQQFKFILEEEKEHGKETNKG